MTAERVLSYVESLHAQGRWTDILREFDNIDLSAVTGEPRAQIHAAISVALRQTATGPNDWRKALEHSNACLVHAPKGSRLGARVHLDLSTLLIDTGRMEQAKRHLRMFRQLAPSHATLLPHVPDAVRNDAIIAYYEGKFNRAITLYRDCIASFEANGDIEEAYRARINLAWSYARSKQYDSARLALPTNEIPSMEYARLGIEAAILAGNGEYEAALNVGRKALEANRLGFDYTDAAEVCLVLVGVARRLHAHTDAFAFHNRAATFVALLGRAFKTLLDWHYYGREGGETHLVHSASRGSRDPLHRGCFSTGIG